MTGDAVRRLLRSVIPADPLIRRLTPIGLANAIGNGMLYVTSALYFTRIAGVSAAQLGVGLTTAAILGVVVTVPVGHAADRWGPRRMLLAMWVAEGVGVAAYTQVRSFAVFLPLVCVVIALDRAGIVAFRAFLFHVLPAETRVAGRAYVRALGNLGLGVGAGLGALALQADTATAYTVVIAVDAASFILSAALLAQPAFGPLRTPAAERRNGGASKIAAPRGRVLRDRPFLVVTALAGILTLQAGLLDVGIPLWVAGHTESPRFVVSVILLLNTLLVAVLQVRMSRGTEDVRFAAVLARRAGLLLALACLLYAAAAGPPVWVAFALLLLGALAHTLAEIWYAAGSTAMSYELGPPELAGAYQGVFQFGFSAGLLLAPLLVTNTALRFGIWGWVMLAALFALAGSLLGPATAWAVRRREAEPVPAQPAPGQA